MGIHLVFTYFFLEPNVGNCRPLGLLAPDRIFARQSVRHLDSYMDTHVDRARSLSAADIAAKAEKDFTLMDSMAARDLDAKVCSSIQRY